MAWPSFSSLRPHGALLGPLMGIVKGAAASVLLSVLMLGVIFARLFGFGMSKEREIEPESNGSDAGPTSKARTQEDADTAASVCTDDGNETPLQVRSSGHSSYPPEDAFSSDVSPTPLGQMLFSDVVGPTPGTPAPAHPAAMTVPAPRTSAPPSPTNILPRNLESLLLAAASAHADDGSSRCAAGRTSVDSNDITLDRDAQALLVNDAVSESRATIQILPVSTPPPAPPPANAKSDSTYHPDAAPTVPRRVPSATAAVPAARVLTAPFEAAAGVDDSSTTAHPSTAAATAEFGGIGCSDVGAIAAAPVAETPTCSWPTRHQINALFREVDDCPDSPDSGEVSAMATAAAGAVARRRSAAPLMTCAAVAEAHSHVGDDTAAHGNYYADQMQQPAAARALRTSLVTIPAVELPATPTLPGPEDATAGEMDGAAPAQGRALPRTEPAEGDGGAGDGRAINGESEAGSPKAGVEVAVGVAQQQQPAAPSPAGTPFASPNGAVTTAASVLPAGNETPQLKGRGMPGPKQQKQQQLLRPAGGVATLKSNGNVTATPRAAVAAASSPNHKRGVVSPTASGAVATPATARRPVGQVALLRSPRSATDRNPVARKLHPISPKPDGASEAPEVAVGQDGGSASPSVRSDSLAASGFLPRYAAPTAASNARKAQLPGVPYRSNTQKLLAAGMSVGAEVGVEDGVGMAIGATPRRTTQEAKLRLTVSGGVLAA